MINGVISAGLPPVGVGIYGRNQSAEWLSVFDFICLHVDRGDTVRKAEALRAMGKPVWIYGTPGNFTPQRWRGGLESCIEMARRVGAVGVIADPENGWRELRGSRRDEEAAALGNALAETALEMRVGVTSFPMMPGRQAMAAATKGRVWGSPQIYDRARPPAQVRRFVAEWEDMFSPGRVIPSVSAWPSSNAIRTRGEFREYLRDVVPPAIGAIGWPTATAAAFYRQELIAWKPGGLPEYARALGTWLLSPVALGILLFSIILLAAIGAAR